MHYRGASLIRNSATLGPYSTTMPRALGGGAIFWERGTPVLHLLQRIVRSLQGYLAHKKPQRPRTLQWAYA